MQRTMKDEKKSITLEKRKYRSFDILRLSFRVAYVQVILLMLLTIIDGIVPTSLVAIVTAYFVDSAIAVFHRIKTFNEIYVPLIILLITTGATRLVGGLYVLVEAKIKLMLERYLLPSIIEVQAKLKYEYIENSECQEMIEITADEMEVTFIEGLQAYVTIVRCVIGIGSLVLLLTTQMWWAAILIMICSIPLLGVSLQEGKKNYAAKVETRKFERRYSYFSDDILCSREAVQERTLFGYADKMTDYYYDNFEKASKIQLHVFFKTLLATKTTSIVFLIITMFTAITLVRPLTLGELTPGMFMGIIAALIGIAKTLGWQLQDAIKKISESKEYMDGLTKLMKMESVVGATDLPEKKPIDFQKIEFKNIHFSYPNCEHVILNDVSFVIEKGRHYAFVGENGVGKSTITKLLTGLYNEYDGEILIDGNDIRTLSQSTIKSLFSVIYQDLSHYEISLKDNILLGNTEQISKESSVDFVLSKVGLKEVIQQLPNGIGTLLGKIHKNGVELSGGQWQKLAIARSILSQAPVKIFDEPTAALDPISENQLYSQFHEVMAGKTSIFISHRLGFARLADEIFVLNHGEIVQKGCHQQLMNEEGIYAHMYEEQSRWYHI